MSKESDIFVDRLASRVVQSAIVIIVIGGFSQLLWVLDKTPHAIRIGDFFAGDLFGGIILFPTLSAVLLRIANVMFFFRPKETFVSHEELWKITSAIGLAGWYTYIFGSGAWVFCNFLNNTVSENMWATGQGGDKILSLLYLCDEYVAHFFLITGLFIILIAACVHQWKTPADRVSTSKAPLAKIWVGGGIWGLLIGLLVIQGHYILFSLPFLACTFVPFIDGTFKSWKGLNRKTWLEIVGFVAKRPFNAALAIAASLTIAVMVVHVLLFGLV